MSGILRRHTRTKYFSISNNLAQDSTLSYQARGMMAYLLSKPDDWQMRVKDLIAQSPAGRDAVYSILRELEAARYIHRRSVRRENGTFFSISEVYEQPYEPEEIGSTDTDYPEAVEPEAVEPDTDKPFAYKRLNKQSTELQSTEREKRAREIENDSFDSQTTTESQLPPTSKHSFGTSENMAAPPRREVPRQAAAPPPNPLASTRGAQLIEGEDSPHFHTPHFFAVAKACDVDLDIVTWRERGRIATQAATLAKKYTTEQIATAAARWPHPTAMTPEQLTNNIQRLLNQRENTTNGKHNATADALRTAELRRAERAAKLAAAEREIAAAARGTSEVGRSDGRTAVAPYAE